MVSDDFCLKTLIRPVIDFPKPGVIFRDITPLYQSPRAMRVIADSFIERYVEADFSHIGAMDARGFATAQSRSWWLPAPWRVRDTLLVALATMPLVVAVTAR